MNVIFRNLKAITFCLALFLPATVFAGPALQTIEIKEYHFMPKDITVSVGTTVTWINEDQVPHTVVEKDKKFRSSALDTGDKYSYTFTAAGTYSYYCSLHTQMLATITVK